MTKITDSPPPRIAAELRDLRASLDQDIPAKILDSKLIIATWNLRAFGDLTEKWEAGAADMPKRDLHAVRCIAEIVSRFDIVALQELRANLKGLPVAQAYGELGNFLKDLQDTFSSKKSLSEAEIIQGLKRTLRIGTGKAIDG